MRTDTPFLLGAALLLVVLVPPAFGADNPRTADGAVSATSCAVMPAGLTLAAVPEDDSPEHLEAGPYFEAAMRERGLPLAKDPRTARLRLVYRIQREQLATLPGGPDLGRLGASNTEGVDVRVNIFSTSRDSLLAGRKPRAEQLETYLRIVARLDQPPGAEERGCIWRGEATARLEAAAPADVTRATVQHLVAAFGETVERDTFRLP